MKQLNLIGFFATTFLLIIGCCKEPEPCNPSYFADVKLKEVDSVHYSLIIDGIPVDSWDGQEGLQMRTIDISERYTGVPSDFRIEASFDLGGPNIDVLNLYSDVFRDSVKTNAPELIEIKDQSGSGLLAVTREGGRNKILIRNSLNCASSARLTYNGRDTLLNLASKQAGTAGGSDHVFYTEDSVFNISFQLLTPCEFWPRELMKLSSSNIQDIEISPRIGVRKEDCNEIQK